MHLTYQLSWLNLAYLKHAQNIYIEPLSCFISRIIAFLFPPEAGDRAWSFVDMMRWENTKQYPKQRWKNSIL